MSTEDPRWYVEFFAKDYLDIYGRSFTPDRAAREAAFAQRALSLKPGDEVLDLACGQGRHAVLLAKAGLQVTGLDLQADYLDMAKESARAAGVSIGTVRADMRMIPFDARFDAIMNMFTAFGYLESEDDDMEVLRQVAKALKPGGRFLLDMINREWVVDNYIQNEWRSEPDGSLVLEHRELDLMTSRNHVSFTIVSPDGKRRESVGHNARLYTLTEMRRSMERAGLEVTATYGGYEGDPYTITTRRMIVVARKGQDT